jgi:L-alanine-DL-glutamate epimerase-like enolase superfamily enzyme
LTRQHRIQSFDPRQPSLESMELCTKFCRLIREAVGNKADLLFGTHGQFTASGAIRFAKQIEPYNPLWFEEPTPPDRPEEMALVARGTSIPVATGERLTTKYEFGRVLELRAASILQMALGRVGGIWEAKKIAGMAEVNLRADCAAPLCRSDRGCGQHPVWNVTAQFPDPREHSKPLAGSMPSCCGSRFAGKMAMSFRQPSPGLALN